MTLTRSSRLFTIGKPVDTSRELFIDFAHDAVERSPAFSLRGGDGAQTRKLEFYCFLKRLPGGFVNSLNLV
jgi:hypothetical protein